MKLYTRTGDKGGTGLFGGQRVSKGDPRVHAYGAVDELNALMGVLLTHLPAHQYTDLVHTIQHDLFDIGSHLSTPYSNHPPEHLPHFREGAVEWQEHHIDDWTASLPELKNFILPGGSQAGAYVHLARTVCRRAERWVVQLSADEFVNTFILEYLNRLSDLLFTLARKVNHELEVEEHPWVKQ